MNKKIVVTIIFVILVAIAFSIRVFFLKSKYTPICKILEQPAAYESEIITIKGKVVDRMSLLAFKYFVLKDNTGEIKVVTKRPLPAVNAKITVKGKIKTAYAIGSLQEIVFVEE
ncbi:MAG: hypothetical protein ACUVQP_09415 [Bacteroidales bacterium]